MKIHLKFNHDSDCSLEALDCPHSAELLEEQMDSIIRRFMNDDNLESLSHLSELIHNEIDYSAILYMATQHAKQKIEKAMVRMLREMSNSDDDEII
jgi:predicted house-cleaning noncanonical NTP pyrophosphatase (MazG superfamily)